VVRIHLLGVVGLELDRLVMDSGGVSVRLRLRPVPLGGNRVARRVGLPPGLAFVSKRSVFSPARALLARPRLATLIVIGHT
jgi:hypothetical protein